MFLRRSSRCLAEDGQTLLRTIRIPARRQGSSLYITNSARSQGRTPTLSVRTAYAPFHTSVSAFLGASPILKTEEPVGKSSTLEKPEGMNAAETEIWNRLVADYSPTNLVVRDISGGCGSMYFIELSSNMFQGKRELQQQRMVLATLKGLRENWHGLQLKTHVAEN